MTATAPDRVLISGGREIGGVASFAESLRDGFTRLGIPTDILPPGRIVRHSSELRNPRVLKILSTTAVFAAPLGRRCICMAHGVPRGDYQGERKLAAIIASFKLANRCTGTQLVSVSHFTAMMMQAVFNVRSDAVIHNPLKALYLEPPSDNTERRYVTYVGRLIAAKNPHRFLPAVRALLDENPGLRACFVGEGSSKATLEKMAGGDPRIEFQGAPDDYAVRDLLRHTRIFISGNEVEGFGISYLEAMSQGCVVAMPACGGGIEIAPESVGTGVQLLPLSWDHSEVVQSLRRALSGTPPSVDLKRFTLENVIDSYLQVDSRFSSRGTVSVKRLSGD